MSCPGDVRQGSWIGRPPCIAVGELVADRSVSVEELESDVATGEDVIRWPVSVEGLPSNVGCVCSLLPRWMMIETKMNTQDCQFSNPCPSFGTEAQNFLQRFSVGRRCHRRCCKFYTASLAIYAWIKTLKLPRRLYHWRYFWLKLWRRLEFLRGKFRCGCVVFPTTVPTYTL